jgi:WD40 repeat protein
MNTNSIKFIYFCFIVLHLGSLQALVVGNDNYITRESGITFFQAETNNKITGLAGIEEGFSLQSPTTTLTFDGFFPVSGPIDFHAGTTYLTKDLLFDASVSMSYVGNFYGNGRTVFLSSSVTTFSIPPPGSTDVESLVEKDREALGNIVKSVDWSYDNQYVAVVTSVDDLLRVYSFNGTALSLVDSIDVLAEPLTVRAHPSGYYFAVGVEAGGASQVQVYELSGGTLSLDDSASTGIDIYGIGWSADGNYLAALYDDDIRIYSYTPGTLSTAATLDWGDDPARSKSAAWDQTGGFVAVGTSDSLRVVSFNGSTIVAEARVIMSNLEDVLEVDWSKTGSWIAMGNDGTTNNLRIYEFNSGDKSLTLRRQISASSSVRGVHWNSDATRLAIAKENAADETEFDVYKFNPTDYSLRLMAHDEETTNVNDVRWSHNDTYLAIGEDGQDLAVFEYDVSALSYTAEALTFDNVNFSLKRDLSWFVPTVISGSCHINGCGRSIFFEHVGSITVTAGSSLSIKNAKVYCAGGPDCVSCYSDDASITFSNCTIGLCHNIEFSKGSLKFAQDVIFTGTNKFIYSSRMTSTIAVNARLKFDLGSTLSYDPSTANRDLFYMPDETSIIHLNNCTVHSTATGLRLTRGTLMLENDVTFSSEGSDPSESISLGDGTSQNDLTIKLMSGVEVTSYGAFRYDNVS